MEGVLPQEIGVFVGGNDQIRRARAAVKTAGQTAVELSEKVEISAGRVSIGTMYLAKGLEFGAVARADSGTLDYWESEPEAG